MGSLERLYIIILFKMEYLKIYNNQYTKLLANV